MRKVSFFSSEPLFFKCIYILGFIGVFHVIYETIFVEEGERSKAYFLTVTLFSVYFIRKAKFENKIRRNKQKKGL